MLVAERSSAPDPGQAAAPDAAWPAADLIRRLERVLDFAAVAVADFGTCGYTDPERPALGFGPEKVVAEATMLGYAAARVDAPGVRRRVEALLDATEPLIRSQAALADLVLHPQRTTKRVVPHVLLTALGRPDGRFDMVARRAVLRLAEHAADEAATVHAERQWIARLWGDLDGAPTPHGPDVDVSTPTALTRPVDLLADGREDPYGLTHLLFYVTDFGRHAPPLGRPVTALLGDVEALLVRHLDRDDFDLSAELLMAWPQLHAPWSPTAAFAFRVLAEAEDEAGVLPCGNVDSERLAALTGAERTRYARATSYHTALVMGLLCAVTLTSRAPLPVGVAAAPGRPDSAAGGAAAYWQNVFASADPAERADLAPMVAAVTLDRALARRDLRGVHESLTQGLRHQVLPGPWLRASTDLIDLLERAVSPSA